jgi:hypothetical protein
MRSVRSLSSKRGQKPKMKTQATKIEEKVLGSLRVGHIRVGALKISVPGFMATLGGQEDLKALLLGEIPRKEIHGVVISQHNADSVRHAANRHDEDKIVGEGVKWGTFRRGKAVLFDPASEIFYLAKPELRKKLSAMTGAPSNFFARMIDVNTDNHVTLWNDAIGAGEYLAVLTWQKNLQMGVGGSSIVIPLTPFIDGSTIGSVNVCLNANMIASGILKDILSVPHAMYFGINYCAFKNAAVSEAIFSTLYVHFKSKPKPDAIIVKIRGLPNAGVEDKTDRMGFVARFMESMGLLSEEFKIPSFLFNAGSYGLAALEYGFNSFSEKLNGSFADDPDPDSITGMPKNRQYGSVYHPEKKINISWEEYVKQTNPHPQVEFSSPPDPTDVSTINFRLHAKHYRAAARSAEVHKIIESVFDENPRGLAEEFQRSQACNVQKLLRNPI